MKTPSPEREPKRFAPSGNIFAALRPKTETPEMAGKLIDEGLSVARLNFSHGDHEEHRKQMVAVIDALKLRPHNHTSILLDTKGPEIRTGNNLNGEQIDLEQGQILEISTFFCYCKLLTTPISVQASVFRALTLICRNQQQ